MRERAARLLEARASVMLFSVENDVEDPLWPHERKAEMAVMLRGFAGLIRELKTEE